MSDVITDEFLKAEKKPLVVVAHKDIGIAKQQVQELFTIPVMNVYINTDVRGVELCGDLRVITALVSGIILGPDFGYNTIPNSPSQEILKENIFCIRGKPRYRS